MCKFSKRFPSLRDKCYHKLHKLHKLFNRNNFKVSYSCLPNISNVITSHSRKILSNTNKSPGPKRNCRGKENFPLNGKCLNIQLIYSCHVKTSASEESMHHMELTETAFKERWNHHKSSLKHESKANSTELLKYVWEVK